MVSGQDSYGRFKVFMPVAPTVGQACDNCHSPVSSWIMYYPKPPRPPQGIRNEDIILGKNKLIGIDCGCYAKGHRQIARIDERMKSRG